MTGTGLLHPLRSAREATGHDLLHSLQRAVVTTGSGRSPGDARVVTDGDVALLPPVVRRYLGFMGVVGRPRVWSFCVRFEGRFRLRPEARFVPFEAWQFNTADRPSRTFHMRLDLAGVLPMMGRDTYVDGHGRMAGRALGLVPVADGSGPEFDAGELVTYLNDAVLLAPSMLLGRADWRAVDDGCFDVAITDGGSTVTARVFVDGRGAPREFRTDDRCVALSGGLVRAPWSTPIDGWTTVDGRAVPTSGRAQWHLSDGDFVYARAAFDASTLRVNVTADQLAASGRRYQHWGATDAEAARPMAGDELVPFAELQTTRAVTIDASPEDVWPWLAQLGQGRGGLYSYDWLENLAGCRIHSADDVLPGEQAPRVGDLIRMGPDGYPCYRVAVLDRPRSLILVGADPDTHEVAAGPARPEELRASWQWELRPTGDGRTRLLSRQRTSFPPSQRFLWNAVDVASFVMERRMLLGIKARAERLAAVPPG
jgi:hypothetical protein